MCARIIKESFITFSCGLETPRNHMLFNIFDLKMQQLLAAGIIQLLMKKHERLDPESFKKPQLLTKEYLRDVYPKLYPKGPKVLTMEHLEAGFVVWMASLLLASITFMLEWINRMADILVIKFILTAFYEEKKLQFSPRTILIGYVKLLNQLRNEQDKTSESSNDVRVDQEFVSDDEFLEVISIGDENYPIRNISVI